MRRRSVGLIGTEGGVWRRRSGDMGRGGDERFLLWCRNSRGRRRCQLLLRWRVSLRGMWPDRNWKRKLVWLRRSWDAMSMKSSEGRKGSIAFIRRKRGEKDRSACQRTLSLSSRADESLKCSPGGVSFGGRWGGVCLRRSDLSLPSWLHYGTFPRNRLITSSCSPPGPLCENTNQWNIGTNRPFVLPTE